MIICTSVTLYWGGGNQATKYEQLRLIHRYSEEIRKIFGGLSIYRFGERLANISVLNSGKLLLRVLSRKGSLCFEVRMGKMGSREEVKETSKCETLKFIQPKFDVSEE